MRSDSHPRNLGALYNSTAVGYSFILGIEKFILGHLRLKTFKAKRPAGDFRKFSVKISSNAATRPAVLAHISGISSANIELTLKSP